MVIKDVNLETVIGPSSAIPKNSLPEVAFAGRSNVGKSTLINGLLNRKSIARVSQSPGKTQTINFYNVNGELYVVDLPGYGFADVPDSVKARWRKMTENYLAQSKQLRMVFMLVDIRHTPSENDRKMYRWIMDMGYNPAVIATKSDKIKRSQLPKQLKIIRESLNLPEETPVTAWSGTTKQGRNEIWKLIEDYVL